MSSTEELDSMTSFGTPREKNLGVPRTTNNKYIKGFLNGTPEAFTPGLRTNNVTALYWLNCKLNTSEYHNKRDKKEAGTHSPECFENRFEPIPMKNS